MQAIQILEKVTLVIDKWRPINESIIDYSKTLSIGIFQESKTDKASKH